MRVIAGKAGGRELETLDLSHLRPMLDRVREALFNKIRFDLDGAAVLDLFAGCGALGIEALSEGAAQCIFVERGRRLADLIRRNLRRCRLEDGARVLRRDVLDLPRREPPADWRPAAVVLVDAPYAMVDDTDRRADLCEALAGLIGGWAAGGARLVLHHRPMEQPEWPAPELEAVEERTYGQSQLTFFNLSAEGIENDAG